jgi:hypothetical protein
MKLSIFPLLLVLTSPLTLAYSIKIYDGSFTMQGKEVESDFFVSFNESVTENLTFGVPEDSNTIRAMVNDRQIDANNSGRFLELSLNNAHNLSISYHSGFYVDKGDFLFDFVAPLDVKNLSFKVALPANSRLERGMQDGGGSIYPKPDSATTDGQRLFFAWKRENVLQGEEIAIYAQIEKPFNYAWMALLAVPVVIVPLVWVLGRRKKPGIEQHLKEDEQIILNVLRNREGKRIEQGTLRVITGFPKASLSRLLTELEARKVIYKEKKGKKNLVWLK